MNMISRWPDEKAAVPKIARPARPPAVSTKVERRSWRKAAAIMLMISGGAYFLATASVDALLITGASILVIVGGLIAVLIWAQNNVDWC